MTLARKLSGKTCRHRWKTTIVHRSPGVVDASFSKTAEDVERCMFCNITRPLRTKGDKELPWLSPWRTK